MLNRCLKYVTFLSALLISITAFAATTPSNDAKLLLVVLAEKGSIQPIAGQSGKYLLSLNNVSNNVAYFTDRPQRKSGQINTTQFAQLWNGGVFQKDPPNAMLEATQTPSAKKQRITEYAVELTQPNYTQETQTLTFVIKPIEGNQTALPDKKIDAKYISLFIDNVPAFGSSCPGCY